MKGGNIVHTVKIGPVMGGKKAHHGSGEGGRFGEVGVMEDFAEETFAGECHEEGAVCNAQGFEVADEGEVVGGGFAESDAGVEANAGGGYAGRFC